MNRSTKYFQKQIEKKLFKKIISLSPIPNIDYEKIPVIYVDNNKSINHDEIKKMMEFEGNLQINDYSDINKRPLLIEYINYNEWKQ